ncbi:MAG: SpoIVB peptidase S55 domain-containing protein [Acidobacteriota bacterium]
MIKRCCLLFGLMIAISGIAYASDPNLMNPADVRAGMKGFGMTVFQGSKPERFEVEILGVLDGFANPKQKIVIAKLSGGQVDKTGVFAGMSGSPVYIDGKLLGAVAYAFPFAKEPIAGIQPIQNMISVVEQGTEQTPVNSNTPSSFNTLMGYAVTPSSPGANVNPLGARAVSGVNAFNNNGQAIIPIATPVTFSGVPQSVIEMFGDDLRKLGIQPVAGLGGSSSASSAMVKYDDTTLAPGSSVNVQLVRGDFNFDAAGTVTYRDGERIYAFGHPFLASGSTAWPMSESSVITVVANLNNSFKLAVGGNLVGSINQDRSTTVFGKLGEQPKMIPMRLNVRTSRNKVETYNYEMINDPFLTPILMRIAMIAAIGATERQLGQQTVKVNGRIAIKGQPEVLLDSTFALPSNAALFATLGVEKPLAALLNSGFEGIDVQNIEVNITSSDVRSNGTLSRLWVDKIEAQRGDKIEIQAFARKDNGAEFVERIPFEIPHDAPLGQLMILVGDGASIAQAEARAGIGADFVPKDLGQLIRAINKIKRNNKLYLKVLRSDNGAIVGNEEMPGLPPSVLMTLNSERTSGGYTPLSVMTVAERELPPSQFLITGQEVILINIVK